MKKYKLDVKQSLEVFQALRPRIKLKQCYTNVFRVVTEYIDKFRNEEWKVAYGFMQSFGHLYVRHCFVVDKKGNVIDPTVMLIKERSKIKDQSKEYVVFSVLDLGEYFEAIEKNNLYPDLCKFLAEEESKCREENPDLMLIG